LNTVLLVIFSIENYESLALDRESMHPLENLFGFVRMDAHDISTPDEMTRTIAHIDILKEAYQLLELEEVVSGRANLAGVQLEVEPTNEIVYDIMMANRTRDHCSGLPQTVRAEAGVLTEEEQIAFLQFREYLGLLKSAADTIRTSNEINSHFKLGSGSRIIPLLTLHGRFQAGGIA
jgi:hypothetical protein